MRREGSTARIGVRCMWRRASVGIRRLKVGPAACMQSARPAHICAHSEGRHRSPALPVYAVRCITTWPAWQSCTQPRLIYPAHRWHFVVGEGLVVVHALHSIQELLSREGASPPHACVGREMLSWIRLGLPRLQERRAAVELGRSACGGAEPPRLCSSGSEADPHHARAAWRRPPAREGGDGGVLTMSSQERMPG